MSLIVRQQFLRCSALGRHDINIPRMALSDSLEDDLRSIRTPAWDVYASREIGCQLCAFGAVRPASPEGPGVSHGQNQSKPISLRRKIRSEYFSELDHREKLLSIRS